MHTAAAEAVLPGQATEERVATEAETGIAVMAEPGRLELKGKMETMPLSMAAAAVPEVPDPEEAVEGPLLGLMEILTFLVKADRAAHSGKAETARPVA